MLAARSSQLNAIPMRIITLEEIKDILPTIDLLPTIEAGFAAYSAGRAVVPPVGELLLDRGEVHIKYGYIQDETYYVVKIASGFYGNLATLGLHTHPTRTPTPSDSSGRSRTSA